MSETAIAGLGIASVVEAWATTHDRLVLRLAVALVALAGLVAWLLL